MERKLIEHDCDNKRENHEDKLQNASYELLAGFHVTRVYASVLSPNCRNIAIALRIDWGKKNR